MRRRELVKMAPPAFPGAFRVVNCDTWMVNGSAAIEEDEPFFTPEAQQGRTATAPGPSVPIWESHLFDCPFAIAFLWDLEHF